MNIFLLHYLIDFIVYFENVFQDEKNESCSPFVLIMLSLIDKEITFSVKLTALLPSL